MTNSTEPGPVWLTKPEAAAYLKTSTRQLDRLVAAGKLTRYKLADGGRTVRFKPAELDALLTPEAGGDLWRLESRTDVRVPEWSGDRAPCGCPRQGDLWLCAIRGPWRQECPTWPKPSSSAA